ncbi:hypothetical protein F5883DRAFT_171435 [Diaporthe sp. PMI_573]|nr:hypothetical protein F5883DRAFT_171435 [Diaporthaceae sp. PMI_573]
MGSHSFFCFPASTVATASSHGVVGLERGRRIYRQEQGLFDGRGAWEVAGTRCLMTGRLNTGLGGGGGRLAAGWGSQSLMPRYPGMVLYFDEQRERKGGGFDETVSLLPVMPWGLFLLHLTSMVHAWEEMGETERARVRVCAREAMYACIYVRPRAGLAYRV